MVLKLIPNSFANFVWDISFSTKTVLILLSFIHDNLTSNAKIVINSLNIADYRIFILF